MKGDKNADLQGGEEQGLYGHEQRPSEGHAAEPEGEGAAVLHALLAGTTGSFPRAGLWRTAGKGQTPSG